MIVSHFIMHDSWGAEVHSTERCPDIRPAASMGAAMTLTDAAAALDIPLCVCSHDAQSLRDAAMVLTRLGYTPGNMLDGDRCLVCQRDRGHRNECLVPVLDRLAPKVGKGWREYDEDVAFPEDGSAA